MKLLTLGSLLALALLAVACSSPPESDPQQVAEQYLEAQGEGDWQAFCQLLVPEDQDTVYRGLYRETGKGSDCASALEQSPVISQAELSETTRGVKIAEVKVDGDQAMIEALTPKGATSVPMVKIDGQWKISLGSRQQPKN